jgi:hypothetical protein
LGEIRAGNARPKYQERSPTSAFVPTIRFEPSIPDLGFFSAKGSDVPRLIELARIHAEERLRCWAEDDDAPPPMGPTNKELLLTVPHGWLTPR